jgi:hypothetical protein
MHQAIPLIKNAALTTMIVMLAAVMPAAFMIIAMVIAVVVALAGCDNATTRKADQSNYQGASGDSHCVFHGRSVVIE